MLLHDYLDYWARRLGDRRYASDGRRAVSWGEMAEWSKRIATWLAERLEPGERFAVLAKNCVEYPALYFGASRAGVVLVPLNTRLAPPEWQFIVEDAGVELALVEAEFRDRLAGVWGGRTHVLDDGLDADSGPVDREPTRDSVLYQMYTSGTTGWPKGAVVAQKAVTANMHQLLTVVSRFGKTAMVVMPLFHSGAAITAMAYTAGGTTLRIVRDWDPSAVLEIMRTESISMTNMVPSMIQTLLADPSASEGAFPSLELIVYGAAPINTELLRRALDVFGCDFVQVYGMTELTTASTALFPEEHRHALESEPGLLLSCGRPFVGTQLRVVDADDRDLPPGEIGEVLMRGPQMMEGYWNLPEATADALRGGWMHTGDAGYLDERGFLFLSDRLKDMIVSGGENVYPRETEEALSQFPGVAEVAVIGVPDERWGEAVKAIVVPEPGARLTEGELIAYCRTRLAGFKTPKSVDFADELPKNATGKILRRELRARYWEGRVRAIS
jgi:acyl-CoA synthetase (AMP-forming)/AMP-acid ligase II